MSSSSSRSWESWPCCARHLIPRPLVLLYNRFPIVVDPERIRRLCLPRRSRKYALLGVIHFQPGCLSQQARASAHAAVNLRQRPRKSKTHRVSLSVLDPTLQIVCYYRWCHDFGGNTVNTHMGKCAAVRAQFIAQVCSTLTHFTI